LMEINENSKNDFSESLKKKSESLSEPGFLI